jgi:hypothetical protein
LASPSKSFALRTPRFYALTAATDEGHCGLPTDELVPLAEKLLEVVRVAARVLAEASYVVMSFEYRLQPLILYRVLDRTAGVTVEKVERFLYRVSYKDKSVLFELNDLSKVTPPPNAITPEEIYIGPVFDDSAIRFFLVFNSRLKMFHYVLDETVRVNEEFLARRQTNRILIGKRTGFAFFHDIKLNRKILIGVFEGNARVNNYFDGPFDQLPDNFIEGDILQKALIEAQPDLAGKIGRLGHFADGSGRVSISPYAYYRTEADLLPFHLCATDPRIPAENGTPTISAYKRLMISPPVPAENAPNAK